MKIRKGRLGDAKEILRILKKTPELQGSEQSKIYTIDFVKGSINNTQREIVFVAEIKGKMAGFLMAEKWKHKGYSFLVDLFVVPDFRKLGVASELIKKYEDYCLKNRINIISMLVMDDNKEMQRFIEKRKYVRGNKMYFYEKGLK